MMQAEVIDKHGRVVRPYRRGDRLADGERIRVPYTFMDHAAYGFRQQFADGTPDHTNPHRPGFRFADTDDADRLAADKAYEEKRARLQSRRNDRASEFALDALQDAAQQAYAARTKRMCEAWRKR